MKEKTNIEILKRFAKDTGRSIMYEKHQYPLSSFRQIPRFRDIVYIPYNSNETSYFVWYSDPYKTIGEHTVFCGAFIPISIHKDVKASIRIKNFFDLLTFNGKEKKIKSGTSSFDSKVIIEGNNEPQLKRILSNATFQTEVTKSLNKKEFFRLSINEFELDFVPGLKGNSYLAIINPQRWNLENDIIEELFESIEKIRKVIVK